MVRPTRSHRIQPAQPSSSDAAHQQQEQQTDDHERDPSSQDRDTAEQSSPKMTIPDTETTPSEASNIAEEASTSPYVPGATKETDAELIACQPSTSEVPGDTDNHNHMELHQQEPPHDNTAAPKAREPSSNLTQLHQGVVEEQDEPKEISTNKNPQQLNHPTSTTPGPDSFGHAHDDGEKQRDPTPSQTKGTTQAVQPAQNSPSRFPSLSVLPSNEPDAMRDMLAANTLTTKMTSRVPYHHTNQSVYAVSHANVPAKSPLESHAPMLTPLGLCPLMTREGGSALTTNQEAVTHTKSVGKDPTVQLVAYEAPSTSTAGPSILAPSLILQTGFISDSSLGSKRKRSHEEAFPSPKDTSREVTTSSESSSDGSSMFGHIFHFKRYLYTAGQRIHQIHPVVYEKMFRKYWEALMARVTGSDHGQTTRASMETFLRTKKLRKLHNHFIFSILHSFESTTIPVNYISRLPLHLRSKVRILENHKKLENHFDSPDRVPYQASISDLSAPIRNSVDYSTRNIRLPGALVIDPKVRSAAKAATMRVSENAVWLLIVATKEYSKNQILRVIQHKQEVEAGKIGFTLKREKRDEPKVITAFDMFTATCFSCRAPAVGYKGTNSRVSFERNQIFTTDDSLVPSAAVFSALHSFLRENLSKEATNVKSSKIQRVIQDKQQDEVQFAVPSLPELVTVSTGQAVGSQAPTETPLGME